MNDELSTAIENLLNLGKVTSQTASEYYHNLTDLGIPPEYAILLTRDFNVAILEVITKA